MITVPVVVIPIVITFIIWAAALFWPIESSGGSYNFGPSIVAAFHFILAIFGTLMTWLLFFIILWMAK